MAEEEDDWPRREEDAEADADALDALADAEAAAEAAAAESPLATDPPTSMTSPTVIGICRTARSRAFLVNLLSSHVHLLPRAFSFGVCLWVEGFCELKGTRYHRGGGGAEGALKGGN